MKEAAISAGALIGLLAFAGIYNHQQSSHRARRDLFEEAAVEDLISGDELSIHDVANMTESDWRDIQMGLGIEEQELIPFEIDEDDVEAKQRRKNRNRGNRGGTSLNRFKLKDVPKLHAKMVEAHEFRMNTMLANFVSDGGITPAMKQPADQLSDEDKAAAHVVNGEYQDFSGNDKTHPTISKFLNEFGYSSDGSNLFSEGNAQLWFLVPAAVPLMGADEADHLGDYGNYWNFIESFKPAMDKSQGRGGNNVRVSIGLYHKGAIYSPRGTKYNTRFPWQRISNFYLRPRTTTQMPYIIPTVDSVVAWIPRFGSASASAGDDCYTFWFHQDFAADANQLLLDQSFAKMDQFYQVCTVMHIFVGFDKNSPNSHAYAAALVPGLQAKVAKDPEFSGVFWVDSLKDVSGSELKESIYKYMTIAKSRAGCRCMDDGWTPPPSVVESTGFGFVESTGGAAVETGGTVAAAVDAVEITYASYEATEAATVRGFIEQEATEAPKIPEIDSCCGHDFFAGTPYDSELRTCCDDGKASAFSDDGSDPCVGDIGFAFK
jgi:hypothetical protein